MKARLRVYDIRHPFNARHLATCGGGKLIVREGKIVCLGCGCDMATQEVEIETKHNWPLSASECDEGIDVKAKW